MRASLTALCALMIMSCLGVEWVAVECPLEIVTAAKLPEGGAVTRHPFRTNVVYCVVGYRWDGSVHSANQGLFISEDGGATWRHATRSLIPSDLFIHPRTEALYAVIHDSVLRESADGFVRRASRDLLVRSTNGCDWKNITSRNGGNSDIMKIFEDPEHSNRVCVTVNNIRNYVLQATDDHYSNWVSQTSREWHEKHSPNAASRAVTR